MARESTSPFFAVGSSPFRAKGILWLGIRQFVKERVARGMDGVLNNLDAEDRAFFSEMFIASGWYDVLPVVRVAPAIAAAMSVTIEEYHGVAASWQAQRDMKGAYAPVLHHDTPEAVCSRFATIYSLCYDFGRVEVVRQEPRCFHACAYGMPEPLADWWMHASESYMEAVLRAAGARNPRLIWSPAESDGEKAGMSLLRIPSRTVWE